MFLPSLPYPMQKAKQEVMTMRGINYSDNLTDGDLAESENLSARRWPYLSTRKAREQQTKYADCTALTAWDKLFAVKGTDLLYDGEVVGQVTAGEKQFAYVNTKLVIWPDKVYYDLKEKKIEPLGAKTSGSGATFAADSVTINWGEDLTKLFKEGDGVKIDGCTTNKDNNKAVVIQGVETNKLTVAKDTFKSASESGAITIEREIPDMDFICERENRLWGCSSEKQTIYSSALGDPKNFNTFQGLSTDSFAAAVGTEGPFTGVVKLTSSLLFFKETKLHKLLGSFPAEYSIFTYSIDGVKTGCNKSCQVINETLFYMGLHGVYAYSGGTPSPVSNVFGERVYGDGTAGTDGDTYFLSCLDRDGKAHLFIYETRNGIWLHEDNTDVIDFARIGKDLYFLKKDGTVWLEETENDDPDLMWKAHFSRVYETIEGKKVHSKLILRTQLPVGSYIRVYVSYDGGAWNEVGQIVGKTDNIVPIRVPLQRCDRYEMKLEGKGPAAVLDILREFSVLSEV